MTNQYNSDLESQLAKLKHLLKEAQDENTRLAETNQREIELHKKEVAQREALENVVAQISSELDLDKVLESIIAGAVTLMGQPTQLVGVVSLVNEQDDRIFVRAEIGAKESWMSYSFTRGEGLTGLVWERGEPIITDSYDKLPRALAPELISSRGPGIGVPIFWQGKIIGVFSVISLNFQRRFTQTNANLMTLFARHAAIAIANARLYAQSQELAIIEERNRLARELHDSVTQLLYSMTLTSRAAKNFLAKKPERVVAQLE
ncbi:MAG: GAF domain-containing protein, partial [Chloroflexota bacterium]